MEDADLDFDAGPNLTVMSVEGPKGRNPAVGGGSCACALPKATTEGCPYSVSFLDESLPYMAESSLKRSC